MRELLSYLYNVAAKNRTRTKNSQPITKQNNRTTGLINTISTLTFASRCCCWRLAAADAGGAAAAIGPSLSWSTFRATLADWTSDCRCNCCRWRAMVLWVFAAVALALLFGRARGLGFCVLSTIYKKRSGKKQEK